jgi:hypothetical protein
VGLSPGQYFGIHFLAFNFGDGINQPQDVSPWYFSHDSGEGKAHPFRLNILGQGPLS